MSSRISRVRYYIGSVEGHCACEYSLRSLLEMILPPDCIVRGTTGDHAEEDEAVLTYGGGESASMASGIHLFESGFFDRRLGVIGVMPKRPVVRLEGIPAIYRDERETAGKFYSVHSSRPSTWVDCHVDIVAGAFFMLSRYEETIVRSVDRFGRFPAEASVAFQEGFLQEPVVNQYAEQLLSMLRMVGFSGDRRRWWKGAPWSIALTHDVDKLHRFPLSILDIARYVAGRVPEGTPGLHDLVQDCVRTMKHQKEDEYNCLPEMAAWEASIGAHAAYYFLGDTRGLHSADYAVDTPGVVASMKAVAGMGHEIGFHAGFWSYGNARRFHEELSRVQSTGMQICGGRQHYLRWRTPVTWRLWEAEDLSYDATLGYSGMAGFRCGTCLPFHPYDIENDREMSIWEWPLMFMDDTYVMSWPDGMAVLEHLARQCEHYGGVLVLLWHNIHWSGMYASAVRRSLGELIERTMRQGVAVDSIRGLTSLSDTGATDSFQQRPV